MKLSITYKNGNTITQSVYWAETKDGKLWFCQKHDPSPVYVEPVGVPMENVEFFRVEEE